MEREVAAVQLPTRIVLQGVVGVPELLGPLLNTAVN